MNKLLIALDMCLHSFISIPLPSGKWDSGLLKQSAACLPFVGLIIGALWLGLAYLAGALLPPLLCAAVIAAFPSLITGFIHLDGFMDTSDALLSWRKREERLNILKDVHVGSFAVVMLVLMMMLRFAACASLQGMLPLLFIPVLSRVGSAFCVLSIKPLGHSEYAEGAAPRTLVRAVILSALLAWLLLCIFASWSGLAVGAATLMGYALAMYCCVRTLGGVSGDLAGFSLVVSELCGLIALAIV